jgi:hypothetical protein
MVKEQGNTKQTHNTMVKRKRTHNTMVKGKRTHNDLQNNTQKTKHRTMPTH